MTYEEKVKLEEKILKEITKELVKEIGENKVEADRISVCVRLKFFYVRIDVGKKMMCNFKIGEYVKGIEEKLNNNKEYKKTVEELKEVLEIEIPKIKNISRRIAREVKRKDGGL